MQKYYFKEKLKALTPNCRTLRDFLSWSGRQTPECLFRSAGLRYPNRQIF